MMEPCPKCGGRWIQVDKDTSSGEEIRDFECADCGHRDFMRGGPALWQVLSDAREQSQAAPAPSANATQKPSLLSRLCERFAGRRTAR